MKQVYPIRSRPPRRCRRWRSGEPALLADVLEDVLADLAGAVEEFVEARGGFRGRVRRTQRRASRMLDRIEHVRQLASGERSRW